MLLVKRPNAAPKTPIELMSVIVSYGEVVFPSLRVALQILLTMAVSIASCERSFSKLKLILSCLRSSMEQDRLSERALLCVEREVLDKINMDDVISQFAVAEARNITC